MIMIMMTPSLQFQRHDHPFFVRGTTSSTLLLRNLVTLTPDLLTNVCTRAVENISVLREAKRDRRNTVYVRGLVLPLLRLQEHC